MPGYVAFPAETPDAYGPLIGAADLRQAMTELVELWSPYYIAEIAQRRGLDTLFPFEYSEDALYDVRDMPADLTATAWVNAPQTDPRHLPQLQGNGDYEATWIVDVNVAARGDSWHQTADMLNAYALAVRALVIQHGALGGIASATTWIAEGYKEVEHESRRSTGVASVRFSTLINQVVNRFGPQTPPTDGLPTPNPTVDQVNVTIIKEGVD